MRRGEYRYTVESGLEKLGSVEVPVGTRSLTVQYVESERVREWYISVVDVDENQCDTVAQNIADAIDANDLNTALVKISETVASLYRNPDIVTTMSKSTTARTAMIRVVEKT